MVIAVLALFGVDLVVIVVFLGFVLGRKRWVKRQPGAFKGAIRLVDGELEGIAPKWHRGYGHWVRDVLVWTKDRSCSATSCCQGTGSRSNGPLRQVRSSAG